MPKLMNSVNRTSEYRNVDNQGNDPDVHDRDVSSMVPLLELQ